MRKINNKKNLATSALKTITPEELDKLIKEVSLRLEEKIEELEEIKSGLEEKIKERTKETEEKAEDLEKSRKALLNILEDVEGARAEAVQERDKTLAIITNFTDGLITFNREGVITMINPQAEKMFKAEESELKGKNIKSLENPLLFPAIDLILKKGELQRVAREEFSPRKGMTFEVTTVPLKEEAIGFLAIFHDVSREKLIEEMKTEFVSLAAHQLRTPLSAIKWTLKMLLAGDLGKITDEQREFIKKTYVSNERMISLINDLLNITRIEEGKYIFKLIPCDIEKMVDGLINIHQEEIEKKEIKLEFKSLKEKLPKVMVDTEKISLVIENLLENAITYTKPKGKIIISLSKKEKKVEFSIKDNGIGIPENQKERIFTKFFRAANVVRMDTQGTGLGLFIAKNIIEAHKGRIWFESEEGKGTTFYFTLPC